MAAARKPGTATLRRALSRAVGQSDRAERQLAIAAVLGDALRPLGAELIVVGGAAVEIYTHGGYSTDDLDLVGPSGPAVSAVLESLGFRRLGKDFIHDALHLYVEFPSATLAPNMRSAVLRTGKRTVTLVSREDLIIDRLCAYKFWRSAIDGVNALLLLEDGRLDETHLHLRAAQEDVADALAAVRECAEEVIRLRLSKDRANALLEARMRKLSGA